VVVRLAGPVLAASALTAWLLGATEPATLFVLAAIVAWSARLLLAVGDAAEGRGGRRSVVLSGGAVVCLVASGALQMPLLVAGSLACAALELLGSRRVAAPSAEPVELREAPVSRAA
jgi:hypothetical protein